MTIINKFTWERISKTLLPYPKIARGVSGQNSKFKGEFTSDISIYVKTGKAKIFVMERTYNLFRTDYIQLFSSWDLPINFFVIK